MKKTILILFIAICCGIQPGNAQTGLLERLSDTADNEFANTWISQARGGLSVVEDFFAQYGIDCDCQIKYDKSQRAIVQIYTFTNRDIYLNYDMKAGRMGAITGMIQESLANDPSGEGMKYVIDQYDTNNLSILIVVCHGSDMKKADLITADDIRQVFNTMK